MKSGCVAFILLVVFVLGGCAKSSQDKEAYLLEKAQAQINQQEYSGALATLSSLDQNKPIVITLTASALAGRAGFNTLSLADLVSQKNLDPIFLLTELQAHYDHQSLSDILRATNLLNSQDDFASRLQYASLQIYKVSQIILKNYTHKDNFQMCSSDTALAANEVIDIIISVNLSLIKIKEVVTNIYEYVQDLQRTLGIDPSSLSEIEITDEQIVAVRDSLSTQIKNTLNTTVDLCEVN